MRPIVLVCLVGVALFVHAAHGEDTITLLTGEVVRGTITSDTKEQIQVETANPARTIFSTRTIQRADVKSVEKETEEGRQQRAMRDAYRESQKFALNPHASMPLKYYDQVMSTVFVPFLKQYPTSPHAQEVEDKRQAWKAERDRVAEGEIKWEGRWLAGDEARKALPEIRAQQLIAEGKRLFEHGQYERAAKTFGAVFDASSGVGSDTLNIARQQQSQSYEQWLAKLMEQDAALNAARNEAGREVDSASRRLRSALSAKKNNATGLGSETARVAAQQGAAQASSDLEKARATEATLRQQIAAVGEQIRSARKAARAAGADAASIYQAVNEDERDKTRADASEVRERRLATARGVAQLYDDVKSMVHKTPNQPATPEVVGMFNSYLAEAKDRHPDNSIVMAIHDANEQMPLEDLLLRLGQLKAALTPR